MALFNDTPSSVALVGNLTVAGIHKTLDAQSETLSCVDDAEKLLGNESFDNRDRANLAQRFDTMNETLKTHLGLEAYDGQGNSNAIENNVLEAGTRACMLYGNAKSLNSKIRSLGFESFTPDLNHDEQVSYAVALAMTDASARSSAQIEKIFPTIEMNGEYVTAKLSIPRYELVGNTKHVGSGAELTDWNRKHLAAAMRDSSILASNSNRMHPVVQAGENDELIVPSAKYLHGTIKGLDGVSFKTGAISAHPAINLMTLCRAPGAAATGSADYNDRIDGGGFVEEILIQLIGDHVVKLDTAMLSELRFGRLETVSSRNDVVASLANRPFRIDLDVEGLKTVTEIAALITAGVKVLEVTPTLQYRLNLHNGSLNQSNNIAVTGAFADMKSVANMIDETPVKTAVADLDVAYVGSIMDLRWSSRNQRIDGLRTDYRTIDKVYHMRAQRVITAEQDINVVGADEQLAVMAATRSVAREVDGFEYLMAEFTRMHKTFDIDDRTPLTEDTMYAGSFYLNQAYVKDAGEIKPEDLVVVESSTDIQGDIGAALVAVMAEDFVQAVSISGLDNTVHTYARGATIVPVIAGPANLQRYIMTDGDARTFGAEGTVIASDCEFAGTSLKSYDDTLIMIPQLKGGDQNQMRAFGFGFTIESVPLIYNVTVTRDGQTMTRLQMTPFYEFTVNIPVAVKYRIPGLSEYLASKKPVHTTNA